MSPYVNIDISFEQARMESAAQHVLLSPWSVLLCPHLQVSTESLHHGGSEHAWCIACGIAFTVRPDRIFVRSNIFSNICAVRFFELPSDLPSHFSFAASAASEPQWLRDMEAEMAEVRE